MKKQTTFTLTEYEVLELFCRSIEKTTAGASVSIAITPTAPHEPPAFEITITINEDQ